MSSPGLGCVGPEELDLAWKRAFELADRQVSEPLPELLCFMASFGPLHQGRLYEALERATTLRYPTLFAPRDLTRHVATAAALVAAGAFPNDTHRTRKSPHCPLETALTHGSLPLALVLLGAGADPNWSPPTPYDSWSCLLRVAARSEAGNPAELMGALLDFGACPDGLLERPSVTPPLVALAMEGRSELVALLLERGANPDILTESGQSALKAAEAHEQLHTAGVIRAFCEQRALNQTLQAGPAASRRSL